MNASNGTFGMPDIIGIEPVTGRFIGIEVKADNGEENEVQKLWKEHILTNNGIHIVAKSVKDVVETLWGDDEFENRVTRVSKEYSERIKK